MVIVGRELFWLSDFKAELHLDKLGCIFELSINLSESYIMNRVNQCSSALFLSFSFLFVFCPSL